MTIDIELQRVAEEAFAGRRGGVVAIDPSNGDVLVFASLPSFDPNGFARGISRSEYLALTENPDQPLFNRVLRGTYPPGSTIKPLMALAGLEYDVIKPEDQCLLRRQLFAARLAPPIPRLQARGPRLDGHGERGDAVLRRVLLPARQHARHPAHPRLDGAHGLRHSRPASTSPASAAASCPRPPGRRGAFPRKEQQVWFPGETVIVGIGQGYWTATLLQLAKATALLAMRGQPYRPRLVRALVDPATGRSRRQQAGGAAAHRARAPGELGDHRRRDGRGDERAARHRARVGRGRRLFDRRQDRHCAGVLGRPDREVQREGRRRSAARPRALRRFRAGGRRRSSRSRCWSRTAASAPRRRPRSRARSSTPTSCKAGAAEMIYGELGDSRTQRTVTGMARLLRALGSTACCCRASSP